MHIAYLWPLALEAGQTGGALVYAAHAAVGFFAAVLFSLSLYAWSRRRGLGLILVSLAFLLFAVKEVVWVFSQMYNSFSPSVDLARTILDLVVLSLFFAAIMIRPRKQLE
jgi:NADH:ubiquinone oxidoreductase subunit K